MFWEPFGVNTKAVIPAHVTHKLSNHNFFRHLSSSLSSSSSWQPRENSRCTLAGRCTSHSGFARSGYK